MWIRLMILGSVICGLLIDVVLSQIPSVREINFQVPPPISMNTTNISVIKSGIGAGLNTRYYWIVTKYPVGDVITNGATPIFNMPSILGGGTTVTIRWIGITGATSYDILYTNTASFPSSGTCIACFVGNSVTTYIVDTGAVLTNYTINTIGTAIGSIRLNNRDFDSFRFEFNPPIVGGEGGSSLTIQDNAGSTIGSESTLQFMNDTYGTWALADAGTKITAQFTPDTTKLAVKNAAQTFAEKVTFAKGINVSSPISLTVDGDMRWNGGDLFFYNMGEVKIMTNPFTTQGDLLYQGPSGPARLASGSAGLFLRGNGVGAAPSYAIPLASQVQNAFNLSTNNTLGITPAASATQSVLAIGQSPAAGSASGNYLTINSHAAFAGFPFLIENNGTFNHLLDRFGTAWHSGGFISGGITGTRSVQIQSNVQVAANRFVSWSDTINAAQNVQDTGIGRSAVGVLEINSATAGTYRDLLARSFRMNPNADVRPTCDSTQRGKMWTEYGAAGVKDTAAVCAKDAGDVYAWRVIY